MSVEEEIRKYMEGESNDEPEAKRQKKMRSSKKEIPEYSWTEKSSQQLAEFVQENPNPYDKKQKE